MSRLSPLATLPLLAVFAAACGSEGGRVPRKTPDPQNFVGKDKDQRSETPPQPGEVANWFTKSPRDGVEGSQAERAYLELKLKIGVEPIVVAVVDSGVDITHEDLKDRLWTNPREIAGNGLDDDGNGYVDDIHGWNFLGSVKNGKNVNVTTTTLEVTRELVRLKEKKAAAGLDAKEEALLAQVTKEVAEARAAAEKMIETARQIEARLKQDYDALKETLGVELSQVTLKALEALKLEDAALAARRDALVADLKALRFSSMARVASNVAYARRMLDGYYNESFDPRREIIGDDVADLTHRAYGNNDVTGPDSDHGTHCAGIIAAARGNGLGIDGVAHDVRIMALRAVPNGDEYDKDIANSVRYAVDNGARVISMSFGKGYSPYKAQLDEAFRYAAAKGVLLVHAAGNESTNTDIEPRFPNSAGADGKLIPNWINVGASASKLDEELVADFSNYGPKTVELFAPGVDILSTVPRMSDGGLYDTYSGTSMATPVVSGVAALVLSQKPELSGDALRGLLLDTARRHEKHVVRLPVELVSPIPQLTYFGALSQTGGIVDAYEALKSALGL